MSAGNSNQNGASASSGQSFGDPAQVLSLSDGTLVSDLCITDTREIEFAFAWKIKNFSLLTEVKGQYLESLTFSSGRNGELKWSLRMYPKGQYSSEDYISVHLNLVYCRQERAPTQFEFSILNHRNEKTHKCRFPEDSKFINFTEDSCYGITKYIRHDALDKVILPDDNLTLFCEGTTTLTDFCMAPFPNQPQFNIPKCNLFENFGMLFENPEFSDFTLSVDGKDLPVHKAILAVRSSVFAAMFKHDMEEKKQNRVTIEDINYDVLREMLLYIYTGKLENLNVMARDLLVAADKYNVSGLKEMCEKTLFSMTTVANAVDLLVLADTYSAKLLKMHVIQFISTHAKEVMLTPAWKNTKLNQLPAVIIEVCEALVASALK